MKKQWFVRFYTLTFSCFSCLGQHCTVMILHRPGCIILEKFLRDFAYLLTVYNVDVRTSLLEQASVDSQGGIALYLQKNLQFCDYVFILITEGEHGEFLQKNKKIRPNKTNTLDQLVYQKYESICIPPELI